MQTLTKERPILFSTPMINPLLDGSKRMTRRIVKPSLGMQSKWLSSKLLNSSPRVKLGRSNEADGYGEFGVQLYHSTVGPIGWVKCPYGSIGDVLWVREAFHPKFVNGCYDEYMAHYPDRMPFYYKADTPSEKNAPMGFKWKPGIHMPHAACRIKLRITDIRVERLQEISEEDAQAEGASPFVSKVIGSDRGVYQLGFEMLWKNINGPDSWNSNPFVWVISFERINQ